MPSPLTDDRPVVVFDDDVQFLRMVERVLEDRGLRVELVTTPVLANAADLITAMNPRLLMVDLFMYGDATGFSFVELLRSRPEHHDLPIVVTSGAHAALARRARFLREHRCQVLPKPFGAHDLLGVVELAGAGALFSEPANWCELDVQENYAAARVFRIAGGAARRISRLRPASSPASSPARDS